MLLHKLRERVGARLKGEGEAGFTLVELLVVMLILGILAAIAIPAFFNQKEKANDSQAKAYAHSAQVAMETFATDNGGSYATANTGALTTIEPTLSGAGGNLGLADLSDPGYTDRRHRLRSPATCSRSSAAANGALTYTCTAGGQGGCPTGGNWGQ